MSARKHVPESVQRTGRRASVRLGTATAGLRLTPDFVMIGASRSGTTSLFRSLMSHPQVVRPNFHKGINYFDLNYFRGPAWYRGHFPVAEIVRRRAAAAGGAAVFEASGYYLYHPFALERMAHDLPSVKLVVMVRDPVERAFSAYRHEYLRGFEWEDFETAVDTEDDRLVGEVDRMALDPHYESFSHRHHAYIHRGHYADQIGRAHELFGRDQVHVVDSQQFFEQPEPEFDRLREFLGLRRADGVTFGRYNGHEQVPMKPDTRRRLEAHFESHDSRLAGLLGWKPSWLR